VALDFEDIGKIGGKTYRKRQLRVAAAEIGDLQPLIQLARPEEACALEVNYPPRDRVLARRGQRPVSKLRREQDVIL
jgi:hypothetical protein